MDKRTNAGQGRRAPRKSGGSTGSRIVLGFFIIVLVMFVGIGCGFLTASMNTKPDIANDIRPPATSVIYDCNGNEIANVHADENRKPVKIAQIPKDLQNAFVAVEDNRFYDHMGIDPRGILRAAWANLRGRTVTEGGSTITQQLAKNAYLTQDRTLKRKIQEVFLALQLERQYTKQEILEMYLNQIYFGQGAYGVQAAAQTYFGKNVEDLTLNECAMLAGIPKSPNYYSPTNNLQAATERKATVLDQMAKYGYINSATATKVKKEPLQLVKPKPKTQEHQAASYFIDYVTQQLIDELGADAVYKEGLQIYTTIDMNMQEAAEKAMQQLPNVRKDRKGIQQPQGALVAIDPQTGYIKAMVGGRGTDQFNRASMAERQPGSAFKPFVFATALENKYTPDSVIEDSPIDIDGWKPMNDDMSWHGSVTMRDTAKHSYNVPTIKLAKDVGIDKVIYYAERAGITSLVKEGPHNDRHLATAIGGLTKGVSPLELVSAYGSFANKGMHMPATAVIKVVDRNGKVIKQAKADPTKVISESSAAQLTSMLEGVIEHGTGYNARLDRPAAGKTGTTDDYRNAWFVGYTPDLVAGVWIGNDDNTSLGGMMGGQLPAKIWKAFMTQALSGTAPKNFDGSTAARRNPNRSGGESGLKSKSETKADTKADNQKSDKKDNKQAPAGAAGGNQQPAAPGQPAAPAPAAPEPGDDVGKGR
jgi:penicillin-binding protein 1A